MRAVLASGQGEAARWGLAFAFAVLAHGAVAAALLVREPPAPTGLPTGAVTIDLEPDPSDVERPDEVAGPETTGAADPPPEPDPVTEAEPPAPDSPPPELAETKPPTDAAPPELTAAPSPVAQAEVVLPPPDVPPELRLKEEITQEKPEPKPVEQPVPEMREERRTAPSTASSAAAALAGGGGRPSPAAVATWAARLGQHLTQHKRYPGEARARHQQGTALVRITLDGSGRVLSRTLVKDSGSAALDQESLSMVLRAQPLPKPPPNMAVPITLTVPVRFSIR